eukprot:SAG11_NODE_1485_length_4822_cov_4.117298_1_plen_92_part_00
MLTVVFVELLSLIFSCFDHLVVHHPFVVHFTIYSLSQYHCTTLDDMRGHILRCRYKTVGDKTYDTGEELKTYLYKYTRYSGTTKSVHTRTR